MDISNIKSVYFLGIGGIGMSALARYFKWRGAQIHGYDRSHSALTDELLQEGMIIHFEENIAQIPDETDLVIYTPAIPVDHTEYQYFLGKQILMKKRSEILGMISNDYTTLAVAGTHGKTTTSCLLTHILRTSGLSILAFLGGISKNYSANFLSPVITQSSETIVITEADEFDRSFLRLHPQGAIITSMDDDHLDVYKTSEELVSAFMQFSAQINPTGTLIYKKGLPFETTSGEIASVKSYSLENEADYYPGNIRMVNGLFEFDLMAPGKILENLTLGLPGRFNLENAVAAAALALEIRIPEKDIREALRTFSGVKRRFDFIINRKDLVYIDDYAHHPEELKACINATREMYPGRRITGVFQPHLFSRTRDFAGSFARSLENLDDVILLEIYPARETPIPGINSQMILNMMTTRNKMICTDDNLITELVRLKPEVLLTMGAGDIDQWPEKIIRAFTNS